jgi:hypothetical protein
MGGSRGWDGIKVTQKGRAPMTADSLPATVTPGLFPVFPQLLLSVVDGALVGLPNDLRGTGGAPGGRIVRDLIGDSTPVVLSAGNAGANGGAGLTIICRGMAMGASAQITLDGASPVTPPPVDFVGETVYAGSGGAGGPGALLVLMDGDTLSVPVIDGTNFSAKTGTITQPGVAMTARTMIPFNPGGANLFYPQTDSSFDVTQLQACTRFEPGE